jgi:hypothetical protein
MLSTVAFTFLMVWVIAVAGPFDVGQRAHGLLLAGLMLLLLAFLKARDVAMARAREVAASPPATRGSQTKDEK